MREWKVEEGKGEIREGDHSDAAKGGGRKARRRSEREL